MELKKALEIKEQIDKYLRWANACRLIAHNRKDHRPVFISDPKTVDDDVEMFTELAEALETACFALTERKDNK